MDTRETNVRCDQQGAGPHPGPRRVDQSEQKRRKASPTEVIKRCTETVEASDPKRHIEGADIKQEPYKSVPEKVKASSSKAEIEMKGRAEEAL